MSTYLNRFLFFRFENIAWSLCGASTSLGTSNREIGDTFFLFIISPFALWSAFLNAFALMLDVKQKEKKWECVAPMKLSNFNGK
ncbi:hypothetical protein [Vibrio alfacsensis]|uniref:hypothetical protein n=1 Tax=Vibrio alfacsensis TaxID=1074311 RepID=UPI0040697596